MFTTLHVPHVTNHVIFQLLSRGKIALEMFAWESGLVRHGLYHEGYVMGDKLNEVLSLHGKKTCTTYGTRTSVRSSRSRKQLVSAHSEATNSSFSTSIDGTGAEEKKDNPAWASSNESKVFIKIFTFMITLL